MSAHREKMFSPEIRRTSKLNSFGCEECQMSVRPILTLDFDVYNADDRSELGNLDD